MSKRAAAAAAEEKDSDHAAEDDDVDWNSVFSSSRIKAQVMKDHRVGRVSNKAAEYIGACSALFLRTLASESLSISKENDASMVTLEHVRHAAEKHDDILDATALDTVSEQSAPKRPRKKRPKLDGKVVKDSAVQKAMVASAAAATTTTTTGTVAETTFQPEVTVDDDDYD